VASSRGTVAIPGGLLGDLTLCCLAGEVLASLALPVSLLQEHAVLAGTVGDMQGSAIAVAAAVADQGPGAELASLPCRGGQPPRVPRLQLGAMRAAGRRAVDQIGELSSENCSWQAACWLSSAALQLCGTIAG
jgi:hypothetical protein